MQIVSIIVLALLCEAVYETLKMIWQEGKFSWDRVGALVVSMVIAYAANADLFVLVNISLSVPFIGIIATGILLSRGANFMHDLLKKVQPE